MFTISTYNALHRTVHDSSINSFQFDKQLLVAG
jgi:hypothetical protein